MVAAATVALPNLDPRLRDWFAFIIEGFLPKQLSDAELEAAVKAAIAATGAATAKDMGRVMASLREQHAGQMDFAKASGVAKRLLG